VGAALCETLVSRGIAVRGACRSNGRIPGGAERVVVGDIDERTDWDAALEGCDVVFHLAARSYTARDGTADPLQENRKVNVSGTERLARRAAASGVQRFVHMSTIKVNGEGTPSGRPFVETDPPAPLDAYGISKWEGEQALHRVADETGLQVVIVRPPLVYGPGVRDNFAQLMKIVGRRIPMPLGSVRNRRDLVFVGNLADACILCATHPAAAGKTYLVSDGEPVSTPELLRKLAEAMGEPSRVLPFPASMLRLAGTLLGKGAQIQRLFGSLEVDSGRIRRELDWKPPYTLRQGFQATAAAASNG
jgi:nucleoside-diphosphate-sugar epimerase